MKLTLKVDDKDVKEVDDASHFSFTENYLKVHTNQNEVLNIPLRSNDGIGTDDWKTLTVTCDRKSLRATML